MKGNVRRLAREREAKAHLSQAVPEVVGVGVGAAKLFEVLNETLSELLLACHGGAQHEQDRCTLFSAEKKRKKYTFWIRTKTDTVAHFWNLFIQHQYLCLSLQI